VSFLVLFPALPKSIANVLTALLASSIFSLDVFSVLPYCSSTPQDYTQVHMGEDKTAQWLVSVAITKRSLSSHDVLSGCLRSEKFFSLLQQIFYGQGSDSPLVCVMLLACLDSAFSKKPNRKYRMLTHQAIFAPHLTSRLIS
jgi:hypothetical protein